MAAADRVPALSPDAEAYGPAAAAVLVVDGGVGCAPSAAAHYNAAAGARFNRRGLVCWAACKADPA